jgi:hypothetical protein
VDAEFPDNAGLVEHDGHFARAFFAQQGISRVMPGACSWFL